jgi:hypothetical protein
MGNNCNISYAITVCNEIKEIQTLLNFIIQHKQPQDEICVLLDKPKASVDLIDILYKFSSNNHILLKESEFNEDFSEWKNKLNNMCTGNFIFNIDADEIPHLHLLKNIHSIISKNPELDLLTVPRINTVENIGLSHIKRWGWGISKLDSFIEEKEFNFNNPSDKDEYLLLREYNLILEGEHILKYYKPIINYPDYQNRIFKNSPEIKWVGKVHESIKGFKTFAYLPPIEEYSLYHHKNIERQKKQNELYNTLI